MIAGDVIYFTSRTGSTYVIQAAEEFLQLGANYVTDATEDFSATPANCDGQLFIRSGSALYCIAGDEGVTSNLQNALAKAKAVASHSPAEEPVEENNQGGRRRFDPDEYFRRQTRTAMGIWQATKSAIDCAVCSIRSTRTEMAKS